MKTDDDIQKEIRRLLEDEMKSRIQISQARLPRTCIYHVDQPLDSRKSYQGEPNETYNRVTKKDGGVHLPVVQTIGLCMFGSSDPTTWPGTICEDPIDAIKCVPNAFTPKQSVEEAKVEFETQLKNLSWVEENLPKIHSLLWVLGSGSLPEPVQPEQEASSGAVEEGSPLSAANTLAEPVGENLPEVAEPAHVTPPETLRDTSSNREQETLATIKLPLWLQWVLKLLGYGRYRLLPPGGS